MKTKRIILSLSLIAVFVMSVLNVQSSWNTANEIGYSSILDLITLNSASAEESAVTCNGFSCVPANGNYYGTLKSGTLIICCGTSTTTSGKKKS